MIFDFWVNKLIRGAIEIDLKKKEGNLKKILVQYHHFEEMALALFLIDHLFVY